MSLKITAAALDVSKFKTASGQEEERLILRGVIDPSNFDELLVDSYQREVITGSKQAELKKALTTSTVPDIEAGMRGDRIRCTDNEKGEYILLDPVYIIDGFQRVSAARALLADDQNVRPRIGMTVHFDTTFEWEKSRFRILNQDRTKVSVNVLLRNSQSDFKSVDMLKKLCSDKTFALAERVQWQQNKLRTDVISALTLARVSSILHARFGSVNGNRTSYLEIAKSLDNAMVKIGRTTMRDNVIEFFEILDECFGIRKITFALGAVQVKDTFLCTLAQFFAEFNEFWDGERLSVGRRERLKLAKFSIDDPEIVRLASSGGSAGIILFEVIVREFNKGKRAKRLSPDGYSSETSELETLGK